MVSSSEENETKLKLLLLFVEWKLELTYIYSWLNIRWFKIFLVIGILEHDPSSLC